MPTQILRAAVARSNSTIIWTNLGRNKNLFQFHREHLERDAESKEWIIEPPFGADVPENGAIVVTSHLNLNAFRSVKIETLHFGPTHPVPWDSYEHYIAGARRIDADETTNNEWVENGKIALDLRNVADEQKLFEILLNFADRFPHAEILTWTALWPRDDVMQKLDEVLDGCLQPPSRSYWFRRRYLVDVRPWKLA